MIMMFEIFNDKLKSQNSLGAVQKLRNANFGHF